MIGRWSDSKVLDEVADRLAKLALGACDGKTHGNSFYASWIGYPTRMNTEALLRTALAEPGLPGDARAFDPRVVFGEAWEKIQKDEGEDDAAAALLVEMYDRILEAVGGVWDTSPEKIDAMVRVLASAPSTVAELDDPDRIPSLWEMYVRAAWPEHPQTPGSKRWRQVDETNGPHESVENPWTRKP